MQHPRFSFTACIVGLLLAVAAGALGIRIAWSATPTSAPAAPATKPASVPFSQRVSDRRPVGMLMISPSPKQFALGTESGDAAFQKWVLARADSAVASCKAMNAQGLIVWDLSCDSIIAPEAQYLGEPRLLHPSFAPVVDAFFARFKEAGLKTGVCVRHSILLRNAAGLMSHAEPQDVMGELIAKIGYARKRWGVSLFYIDSNLGGIEGYPLGGQPGVMDRQPIVRVLTTYPDVVPIWEATVPSYAGWGFQYQDARVHKHVGGTPALPAMISISDTDYAARAEEYAAAARGGAILLFRCWYRGSELPAVKSAYHDAGIAGF